MSTPPERWWGRPLTESCWLLELSRLHAFEGTETIQTLIIDGAFA
jgi:hypothetical protein